jgi:hypothetical protein
MCGNAVVGTCGNAVVGMCGNAVVGVMPCTPGNADLGRLRPGAAVAAMMASRGVHSTASRDVGDRMSKQPTVVPLALRSDRGQVERHARDSIASKQAGCISHPSCASHL